MRANDERAIADFRLSLATVYLLKYGLAALAVWGFVYGVAVLALRGAAGLSRLDLLWGLATLPVALAPVVWLAVRRLPSRDRVRAALDRHGRCGGLVMAGAERPLDEWAAEVPAVRTPGVKWDGGWVCAAFAIAVAFVCVGFLVPQAIAALGAAPRLDVDREVERLEQQIEVLKKEKIITAERAEELKMELEKLRREASGKDPIKTLDSLDRVQEQMKKAAEEAAEKANKNADESSRLEALANALREKGDRLDDPQMKEALRKLADLMRKAAEENEHLQGALDKEVRDALEKNALTKEMLKKVADALKEGKQGEMMKVAKLVKANLIDPAELGKDGKDGKDGKGDAGELMAYLKDALGKEPGDGEGDEDGEGGGTGRGGGKSKLTFGDESTEEGVKFKEEQLKSFQMSLKDSTSSGVSQGAPNIGKEKAERGAMGALFGSKTGGGSAATQTVLPRHRGAVERYFDRGDKTKK